MTKIINCNNDIRLFLEDINSDQAENLVGGYCQFYHSPYFGISDISEIINNAKKQTITGGNKYSNQKINSIDNSKKSYFNGVLIPRTGKSVVIYSKYVQI
ncbi:hypothetical protein H6F32_06550 [Anabaena sp. FACHB-1237]|uniref:hypothetical protein n=1 Tax=Anabaena sp. FACHB-1237 TaxID=2692769 RepID=UPI00168131F5|nr:hypothetical protein [Anabaena sp. FACHB-1237]MBD2137253.1 hypothetical protein [Anabaena sp. FACHB-1237]